LFLRGIFYHLSFNSRDTFNRIISYISRDVNEISEVIKIHFLHREKLKALENAVFQGFRKKYGVIGIRGVSSAKDYRLIAAAAQLD
jgi:coenzyme F420-reducing hydrogenase beta subunit